LIKKIEEKLVMNPLYEDDIENEFQQNINDIKEQKKKIQTKLNHEKIEIKYLLCNTSTITHVIKYNFFRKNGNKNTN
jgi:hypothetical protein